MRGFLVALALVGVFGGCAADQPAPPPTINKTVEVHKDTEKVVQAAPAPDVHVNVQAPAAAPPPATPTPAATVQTTTKTDSSDPGTTSTTTQVKQ